MRVRESMLVSQQLYGFEKYQNKKEIQIKNGETITILLNKILEDKLPFDTWHQWEYEGKHWQYNYS